MYKRPELDLTGIPYIDIFNEVPGFEMKNIIYYDEFGEGYNDNNFKGFGINQELHEATLGVTVLHGVGSDPYGQYCNPPVNVNQNHLFKVMIVNLLAGAVNDHDVKVCTAVTKFIDKAIAEGFCIHYIRAAHYDDYELLGIGLINDVYRINIEAMTGLKESKHKEILKDTPFINTSKIMGSSGGNYQECDYIVDPEKPGVVVLSSTMSYVSSGIVYTYGTPAGVCINKDTLLTRLDHIVTEIKPEYKASLKLIVDRYIVEMSNNEWGLPTAKGLRIGGDQNSNEMNKTRVTAEFSLINSEQTRNLIITLS